MSFSRHRFLTAITGTLKTVNWYRWGGHSAVMLLAGTAAAESDFGTYQKQIGGGPARGVFQMEHETQIDIYDNFFPYRPHLCDDISFLTGVKWPDIKSLEHNLTYQILLARVHYLRVPEPLPAPIPESIWPYYKRYWNTHEGAATKSHFMQKWERYMDDA